MITLRIVAVELMALLCTYAQGTMDFRNDSATLSRSALTGQGISSMDGFVTALYRAPFLDPSNFTQLGAPTPTGAPPEPVPAGRGRFSGGNRVTGTATQPGETARIIVKIWEPAYGATYEKAFSPFRRHRGLDVATCPGERTAGGDMGIIPGVDTLSVGHSICLSLARSSIS